jgi:hypothetical protein
MTNKNLLDIVNAYQDKRRRFETLTQRGQSLKTGAVNI